jgi:hypothetical protein
VIGRNKGTISRELRRNALPKAGYTPIAAERFLGSPPDRDWQQVCALSNKLSLCLYPADPRIESSKTGSPLWGARNRRKLSSEPGR